MTSTAAARATALAAVRATAAALAATARARATLGATARALTSRLVALHLALRASVGDALLQVGQFLANLDEAEVQLAAEVVGQTAVVVVDAQVGAAHLAHAQLLLLVARRRHRVAVVVLSNTSHTHHDTFC